MGLDKKSSPPKRKARSSGMKRVCPWEHAVHCQLCDSSAEPTSREDSSSVVTRGHGTSAETVEKSLETEEESSEEEMENQSSEEEEDSDENGSKNGAVFPKMSRGWEMGEDDSGEGVGLWTPALAGAGETW